MTGRVEAARTRRVRRPVARALVVVVSLCAFGTLLLPWTREGSTYRNAFSLSGALDAAGLITTTLERSLYDALIVVPVIVALVCVASLLGRDGIAALLASIVGAIEFLASVAVIAKVGGSVEMGPWLSLAVGSITMAAWPLWQMTRERGGVR